MRLQLPPHEPIFIHPYRAEVRLWRTDTQEGVTLRGAAARVYKEWWILHLASRADNQRKKDL